jgi:hypothetical protein
MIRQINLTENEIDTIIKALGLLFVQAGKINNRLVEKLKKPHKKIKTASAKAKGRNLQKWAVEKIAALLDYKLPENKDDAHIRSREMGQAGVDVVLSKKARVLFPFAVECKNCEKINLKEFMEQAEANSNTLWPLLIVKNNTLKEPLLVMKWKVFATLFEQWKRSPFYIKGYLD